jgi:hypothetical protein
MGVPSLNPFINMIFSKKFSDWHYHYLRIKQHNLSIIFFVAMLDLDLDFISRKLDKICCEQSNKI